MQYLSIMLFVVEFTCSQKHKDGYRNLIWVKLMNIKFNRNTLELPQRMNRVQLGL